MANKHVDDHAAVTERISTLPAYQDIAKRLHEVIVRSAPHLEPRLWYGMPGYAAAKRSPVLCFFRVDADDYVTFGLTEKAHLAPDPDSGHQLIGSAWFLTELDEPTEIRIAEIVRSAVHEQAATTSSPA